MPEGIYNKIRSLSAKILNIIKQAFYSLVDEDSSSYPVGQATVNQKATRFIRLSTYGVCANPPEGSHILLLNSQGQESVKFGIINDFLNRKKGLKAAEVALYNVSTEDEVYLRENGTILITSETVTIDGDLEITGDLNVTGNINAANIDATGDISADGDVTAGTVSLKSHIHSGVEPGSGNSGAPVA